MGADTTAIAKRRKKSNEPENQSRKIPVWTRSIFAKMFIGIYWLFAHSKSIITTIGKHLLGNGNGCEMFVGPLQTFTHR